MWLWMVVAGCTAADPPSEEPAAPAPAPDPEPDPPEAPDTTYHQDVAPWLHQYCGRCHDGSGIGPGDFSQFAEASILAELILDRIDAGLMPPPAADPTCHDYQGHEWMVLPDEVRQGIARWVELGAPPGDPATPTPLPEVGPVPLSRHDLEVVASAPYTPQFVDGNEYRCFLLHQFTEDVVLTGFDFLIDNREVSHHALLFVDPDAGNQAKVEDEASQSWPCEGVQPEEEYGLVHAWAPSGGALEFPDGMGLPVAAGSQIVLQMHYFEGMPDPTDQPGYALKLEDRVRDELFMIGLGPIDFRIPAGDPEYTATELIDMFWLTLGFLEYDVWGILPHMHVLGTGYDFVSVGADGTEGCISRSDAYDFDMQPTYWFDTPVTVGPEDTLSISCTWDNSAANPNQLSDPPVNVTWGENTQEEMCFALMYVHARIP